MSTTTVLSTEVSNEQRGPPSPSVSRHRRRAHQFKGTSNKGTSARITGGDAGNFPGTTYRHPRHYNISNIVTPTH